MSANRAATKSNLRRGFCFPGDRTRPRVPAGAPPALSSLFPPETGCRQPISFGLPSIDSAERIAAMFDIFLPLPRKTSRIHRIFPPLMAELFGLLLVRSMRALDTIRSASHNRLRQSAWISAAVRLLLPWWRTILTERLPAHVRRNAVWTSAHAGLSGAEPCALLRAAWRRRRFSCVLARSRC